MSQKRDKRQKEKAKAAVTREHQFAYNRRLILKFLGDDHDPKYDKLLHHIKFLPPKVVFNGNLPEKAKEQILNTYKIDLGGINANSLFTHAYPLVKSITSINWLKKKYGLLLWANSKLKLINDLVDKWGRKLLNICDRHSRPDLGYITTSCRFRGDHDELTVKYLEPIERQIKLSSGIRTVYMVRDYDTETTIKLDGINRPFFIQKHTIRRYMERLDVPSLRTHFTHLLGFSAVNNKPTFYRGRWLLPMTDSLGDTEIGNALYGYFILEPINDIVVATTFIFVAMRGTPQGDTLQRRLQLEKADMEYHNLNRLSVYVNTDLANHKIVSKLLSECGLKDIIKRSQYLQSQLSLPVRPFAEELLQYIET